MVSARVHYHVEVTEPEKHLARVTVTLTGAEVHGDSLELAMAAWCPGSYLIRDYARFVRELCAENADTGAPLRAEKLAKASWRITRDGARTIRVRYTVYGHELSVRTNHIDASHAFLHGPATFAYFPALRLEPVVVSIAGPKNQDWPVVTALAARNDGFYAADIDELFDAPIHLGPVTVRELSAAGKPVSLAVWGQPAPGPHSLDDLCRDLETICATHAARFGGVPYERYTFILMLSPDSGGGLEHRTSSANLASPLAFCSRGEYEDLLELLSHEYFHLWNGKRLYPAVFARPDLGVETYTRCLWVIEGMTAYFDRLTVARAGAMSARRYLDALATDWARLQRTPGRHRHSLREASFDAWIKLYKPDESNINTTVSYYLKGSLALCALDLFIRRQTAGERSLESVLAHLWEKFGRAARGYPEDVRAEFEAGAGLSLAAFFDQTIEGTADPALDAALSGVGLTLRAVPRDNGPAPPRLGIQLGDNLAVTQVLDGEAGQAAGLSPGDELLALDGYRMRSEGDVRRYLAARRPGETIAVALFRRGRLAEIAAVLGDPGPARFEIAAVDSPTDEQKARYLEWLGDEHPGPGFAVGADANNGL